MGQACSSSNISELKQNIESKRADIPDNGRRVPEKQLSASTSETATATATVFTPGGATTPTEAVSTPEQLNDDLNFPTAERLHSEFLTPPPADPESSQSNSPSLNGMDFQVPRLDTIKIDEGLAFTPLRGLSSLTNSKAILPTNQDNFVLGLLLKIGLEGEIGNVILSFLPKCGQCQTHVQAEVLDILFADVEESDETDLDFDSEDGLSESAIELPNPNAWKTWCINCVKDASQEKRNWLMRKSINAKSKASVEILLKFGISANIRTPTHPPPLKIAQEEGDMEIIKYLLESGAKPTTDSAAKAIHENRPEQFELLLASGVEVTDSFLNADNYRRRDSMRKTDVQNIMESFTKNKTA